MAPAETALTYPAQLTRWLILQKARSHPEGLLLLESTQFHVYFTPLPGVLFTFPSRYLFAIDLIHYLALEGGPPRFKPDYTCPTLLRNSLPFKIDFRYTAITFCGAPFQKLLLSNLSRYCGPTTPPKAVWAPPGSLVTTTGIFINFLFPATEIFQFADFPRCG